MQSYRQELRDLHHRRTYYILLAYSCMILLFSMLDAIVAADHFKEFLSYRLIAALIGAVLLVLHHRDHKHAHAMLFGFSAYLCVSTAILIMIYRMGGVTSPYYVGLLISIAIYSTLAPLTLQQTLGSGFLLVCGYAVICVSSDAFSATDPIELFMKLFFMACFVFIIATQSWVGRKAQRREYELRKEEIEAADELAHHAVILEEEVLKRSREQAASEERYRQLFNQIANDVVVIGRAGEILQSNISFDYHYTAPGTAIGMSFFDLIVETQKKNIQKTFAEMIENNESLSAYQVRLIKKDTTVTDAEINADILTRDEEVIGILIIIRDMSTRKKLERKLIESLEIKKKTETAAILALAKLSEFKDAMAGNHLERIREYCKILASELSNEEVLRNEITPSFIEDIYNACILHDIGKVAIPDNLLGRNSQLERAERDQIRKHTIIGGDLIKEMEEESKGTGFLSMAKHIAYFHHERWDGKGYPYGLMAEEIPLAARIMAVANTYEEMTAGTGDSPETIAHQEVVQYIDDNKGRMFDPIVVKAFLAGQREFDAVRQKLSSRIG